MRLFLYFKLSGSELLIELLVERHVLWFNSENGKDCPSKCATVIHNIICCAVTEKRCRR